MQFGVHLPHIGPWHDGDTLRRFAVAVEEMGYDSVWVSDHIVFPLGFQSRYPYAEGGQFPLPPVVPWLEPVTTLTFVAGATSRVKLGTSILVLPYRNPVLNGKQLGNLQAVSGAGSSWARARAGCARRRRRWACPGMSAALVPTSTSRCCGRCGRRRTRSSRGGSTA